MGDFYYCGEGGVKRDYQEAVKYYRLAANQGDANGEYELGQCYHLGKGVKEDFKEAKRYYGLAAEKGHLQAQVAFGNSYMSLRESDDPKETARWYMKAAVKGELGGVQNLKDMYELSDREAIGQVVAEKEVALRLLSVRGFFSGKDKKGEIDELLNTVSDFSPSDKTFKTGQSKYFNKKRELLSREKLEPPKDSEAKKSVELMRNIFPKDTLDIIFQYESYDVPGDMEGGYFKYKGP